ncbi:hypothetical protein QYF61_014031 [Mycteria americana]|uniref:Uncharacterized protein n=1 Tax=Mycteria americana TaxID=33587 RepID=A0AAN7SAC0_MYCAM|nr:hypothetical protein QYF61_014031 [Mycteria americana]
MRSPLSLLFSKLDKPKVLSHSSQDMPSSPSTSFVALLWMHSRTFTSFLICGAQNCTQYSRCRIRHLDLLNFIPLIIAQCSNLSRSLCKASCPSRESTAPPCLVSSANLLMVHSTPASRSLINILNRTGPRIEPRGTPLLTGCQPDILSPIPPGRPVPMLDHPFSKEIFPNIQSKPLLMQLEAISSCPITSYLGEETDPHLSTTSFQVTVESDKVSPQPPLLQTKQSQFPQPLLIRLLLQTLHQLCCSSLDTLQHLNVSLVVRGPKLNTVFEGQPHQCRVQGDNHFPSPAGHAIFDTSQDAIGFLGHLGTLLAHIQPAVNQHPQVLLCQAAFQPLFPKPVALHGVFVTQVQDPAHSVVKPHTVDLSPLIQPVQIPLQNLHTLEHINTPTQFGVMCKLN